jgi:hypothetical protein
VCPSGQLALTTADPDDDPRGDAFAYLIINDPGFRYIELDAGYYARLDPKRQTSNKIRELEAQPRDSRHPDPA